MFIVRLLTGFNQFINLPLGSETTTTNTLANFMLEVDNECKSSGYRIIYNNHLSQHSDYGDYISRAINYAVSKKKMVVVALNIFPSA